MGSFSDLEKLPYADWKKVVWRFGRVFVSAFLVTGSLVLINAEAEVFASWENFRNLLIYPFALSGAIAGINALGKLIREIFGADSKDSLVDKILF